MQNIKTYIISLLFILFLGILIFFIWEKYKISLKSVDLHNKGNLAMQEYYEGIETSLIGAEQYYRESLEILEHPNTRNNYNIAQSLLIKNREDQEVDDTFEPGEEISEINISSEEEEKYKDIRKLSQEEKKHLEKVLEQIKAEQKKNQKYYNKVVEKSGFQNTFDSFFGELDRGGEKDW